MSETSKLTEEIILVASQYGARLFRNNSGVATYKRGSYTTRVRYGVGPTGGGGGDLIGWDAAGRFLSIEIKTGKDRQTKQQKMWAAWVENGGGRAGVVRSVDDLLVVLGVVSVRDVVCVRKRQRRSIHKEDEAHADI